MLPVWSLHDLLATAWVSGRLWGVKGMMREQVTGKMNVELETMSQCELNGHLPCHEKLSSKMKCQHLGLNHG